MERQTPVRRGSYSYAGRLSCEVRIIQWHTLYGSGSPHDPPQLAQDRAVTCYYILYRTPADPREWVRNGGLLTYEEALERATSLFGGALRWENESRR
ncbi:MAG TPA: hypothetical protein VGN52_00220 [Burkholderiales bacterium]|jgi:hypothetical protein